MKTEIRLREADSAEIRNWDTLISNFKNFRVTHTTAWLRSLESSINGSPLYLVCEKDGKIVACLPGIIVNLGLFKIYGSPLPGWQTASMGPVFDAQKISSSEIIEPLVTILDRRFGVHHAEIVSRDLDLDAMVRHGFTGRPEFTFQAPLFPDAQDTTLKRMKASARRNITRAKELGLTVQFRDDEDFIDEVYDQISEVFVRGGNVVPFPKKRVMEFYRSMRQSGRLIAVEVKLPDDRTSIATGLFTMENHELLLWMWAHRTEYRWFRPTELMTWAVMQRAMDLGCTTFDFGGRGGFKAKFGATMNGEKTRWIRSRYAWLTVARDLAEELYRLQQALRGRHARRSLKTAI